MEELVSKVSGGDGKVEGRTTHLAGSTPLGATFDGLTSLIDILFEFCY